MLPRIRIALFAGPTAGALMLSLIAANTVAAHSAQQVGDFHVEIGWLAEPALVGQPNAVQVTIRNHDESPVTDLGPDDLTVTVSTGGQDSGALALTAAFDAQDGEGSLGEYRAELIPTAPGDYTFHFTGRIHDTSVDLTLASGDGTFDPVVGSSDLEFPVKQPTLTEVGTRLDRIDGRVQELQSSALDPQTVGDLRTAASGARNAADAANQLALLGVAAGLGGMVLAIVAILYASRARRAAPAG